MDDIILRNYLLRYFEERTTGELRLALDEVKLWRDGVTKGLVKPEQASRYIESAKRITTLNFMCWDFLNSQVEAIDALLTSSCARHANRSRDIAISRWGA
jgi:hypothetical protein